MNHLTDPQLNEYLDDAMDAHAHHEAEAHLQSCVECRARLGEFQAVFASLAGLPEARLARDLSANVLARLPQKQARGWTPSFAAQAGAALGVLIWISTQVERFIPSDLTALRFPAFMVSVLQLPNPNSLLPVLHSLFTLPTFHLPALDLPSIQLSTINLSLIIFSAFALWVIGNAALLRNHREARK